MELGNLNFFQLSAIEAIGTKERSGVEVQSILNEMEEGLGKSGPAFYQAMGRLEKFKLVSSKYETRRVGNRPQRFKVFKLEPDGADILEKYQRSRSKILNFNDGGVICR